MQDKCNQPINICSEKAQRGNWIKKTTEENVSELKKDHLKKSLWCEMGILKLRVLKTLIKLSFKS